MKIKVQEGKKNGDTTKSRHQKEEAKKKKKKQTNNITSDHFFWLYLSVYKKKMKIENKPKRLILGTNKKW